jgi:hypothetical protein
MGAEKRKGRLYFYTKRRDGERVVSEYLGRGAVAELAAFRAERDRQMQEEEKLRLEARKLEMAEIDSLLDDFDELARNVATGALLAAGFHQHKGQWRKKRDVSRTKA